MSPIRACARSSSSGKSPKAIDIRRGADPETETERGIYALDGDTLRLCINEQGKPARDFRPAGRGR